MTSSIGALQPRRPSISIAWQRARTAIVNGRGDVVIPGRRAPGGVHVICSEFGCERWHARRWSVRGVVRTARRHAASTHQEGS